MRLWKLVETNEVLKDGRDSAAAGPGTDTDVFYCLGTFLRGEEIDMIYKEETILFFFL